MKIIRKAIYPSPCSLLFLPFLLSFSVWLSAFLSLSLSLRFFFSVVLPYYFIHTLNGNRVPVPDERLVLSLMEIAERSLDTEIVRMVITYSITLIILIISYFKIAMCHLVAVSLLLVIRYSLKCPLFYFYTTLNCYGSFSKIYVLMQRKVFSDFS